MFEILSVFVLISLFIERSLSQIFETKIYKFIESKLDKILKTDIFDLKPWISIIVSVKICFLMNIDLIASILSKTETNLTKVITGLLIAGGATGIFQTFKTFKILMSKMRG